VPPIEATIVAPRFDGLLLGKQGHRVQERLIAAPTELELAGRRIAQTPSPSTDLNGLALWQVDPPTRIRMWTSGFQPNGDIVGDARITVYGCERGRLSLTLLGKQGTPVVLAVDGLRYATIQPRSGTVWQGDIPAPSAADGGVCVFEVHSSGLLGSTIITFEPD